MRSKKGSRPTTVVNATTKITAKKPKIELLPCPCGAKPRCVKCFVDVGVTESIDGWQYSHFVEAADAHEVYGPALETKAAAAAAWNAMIRTWREKAK